LGTVDVQTTQVRPRPFRRAFAAASILPALFTVSGLIAFGVADSHALGRALGHMFTMTAIPGLLAGLLAWRSRTGWPWWKHLLVVIPVQLVLFLMDLGGRAMR
jgi:hypothetical protein